MSETKITNISLKFSQERYRIFKDLCIKNKYKITDIVTYAVDEIIKQTQEGKEEILVEYYFPNK